jgi:hypothetical protein
MNCFILPQLFSLASQPSSPAQIESALLGAAIGSSPSNGAVQRASLSSSLERATLCRRSTVPYIDDPSWLAGSTFTLCRTIFIFFDKIHTHGENIDKKIIMKIMIKNNYTSFIIFNNTKLIKPRVRMSFHPKKYIS